MSTSALSVINEAALAVGDPQFSRIARVEWRDLLNQSSRDLARKLRLVLWTATFDLAAASDEYALPADCIQVKGMRWNDTPSDSTTWRKCDEWFEDEFNGATDGSFSEGDPAHYFVRVDTFHLYPRPGTAITGGGKIIYWGLPDDVTDEATQVIPIMDMLRDSLRERMVIHGLRRLDRFDKAAAHEQEWQASLTSDRDRLEDRSADRRSRIRTRPGNIFGQT